MSLPDVSVALLQPLTTLSQRRKVVINFGRRWTQTNCAALTMFSRRWLSACILLFVRLFVCLSVCLLSTNRVNTWCNGRYKSYEQRSLQPLPTQQLLRRPLHRVLTELFRPIQVKVDSVLNRLNAMRKKDKCLQAHICTKGERRGFELGFGSSIRGENCRLRRLRIDSASKFSVGSSCCFPFRARG